jgi:hypothetical protein
MNEQELREMIRASIARHQGATPAGAIEPIAPASHVSHLRLPLVSGDEEGACLIEPSVRCNHCGYCLSLGH